LLAPVAHAGLSSWTSLAGLTANDGANWVRVYATGTPPTTIYAGTDGDGVFKSTDDGLTWAPFSSGLEYNGQTGGMQILAFFTGGGKVYAATDGGLFSAPDTASPGGSWTPVSQGPNPDPAHPTQLGPQSVDSVISLTAGPMLAGVFSEGVYRSGDGGQTWTPPAADNGMAAGTTVWGFASFANFVWAASSNGIYRSSDQGSTWTLSSDGIGNATTLGIFQDTQNPLIYYAETGSDGIFRSIDGGTTWQSVNGDPGGEQFGGGSTPIIRAIQEFSGQAQTRLYVATSDGLWVGTLPNVIVPGTGGKPAEVPGQIAWRPVTKDGLGYNTIFWALSSFTSVPGTLLAGTQSNGGYSLTFQPPVNVVAPGWFGPLNVGVGLVGNQGSWDGTEQIDYSYQWQRCTNSSSSSCTDIGGATDKDYALVAPDQGYYIRLAVTAANDFPTFGKDHAYSSVQGPVAAQLGPLPGDNQISAPSVIVSPSADQFLPTEGDTLSAPPSSQEPSGWLFNPPATTVAYKWLRCDANGDNCEEIPGATGPSYVLTAADDGLTLRVEVTGYNNNGATTLPLSGATNPIIPLLARQTSPPVLLGNAYVGSSLVGTVGTWASPATWWTRQWEQCQPDGSACSPIQGETSPEYVVRADDYGMRIRLHVTASVVPPYHLPPPVDAYTPVSAIVTYPPGVAPPGVTPPTPTPKPGPPTIGPLALRHAGNRTEIVFSVSGPGSVTVALMRVMTGHRSHHGCVKPKLKHKRGCRLYSSIYTIRQTVTKAGTLTIVLPTKFHGRTLPLGQYRLIVTPASTAGAPGAPRSLGLVFVHR
jgi:hypothetical protein